MKQNKTRQLSNYKESLIWRLLLSVLLLNIQSPSQLLLDISCYCRSFLLLLLYGQVTYYSLLPFSCPGIFCNCLNNQISNGVPFAQASDPAFSLSTSIRIVDVHFYLACTVRRLFQTRSDQWWIDQIFQSMQ